MATLDHVGIAVRKGSPLAKILSILSLQVSHSERVERESLDVEWVPLQSPLARLELLHAYDPNSVIGKFLEKNGKDGIHHLCFRVEDIKQVSESIVSAGFQLVYPEPKLGAHNCLVNFVHPQSTGGLLLEISEKTGK